MERVVCYIEEDFEIGFCFDIEHGVYICTKCGYYEKFTKKV
jgi:hypothetical protein